MAATAYLVHRMRGRARLRVPSQKGHPEYFAVLEKRLLEHPAVHQVTTNPVTASAVVHYDANLDPVIEFAKDKGLFQVEPGNPESDQALRQIHSRLGDLDVLVKERSKGAWGLGSLSFYGLLGATVYQLYKGEFMPAGGTLLIQALKVLVHASQDRDGVNPGR